MARTIILDTFPLSCVGKNRSNPPTVTDHCRQWIMDCIAAGNPIRIPAIAYYEALRELERLNAVAQIMRFKSFCFTDIDRFIPLQTVHLDEAAKIWGVSRNAGNLTASPDSLDGDVIIASQVLNLGISTDDYVVATTNAAHLRLFVPADQWTRIVPGS